MSDFNESTPDHIKYPNRWSNFGRLYDSGEELPSGVVEVRNETDEPENVLRDGRGLSGIEI